MCKMKIEGMNGPFKNFICLKIVILPETAIYREEWNRKITLPILHRNNKGIYKNICNFTFSPKIS